MHDDCQPSKRRSSSPVWQTMFLQQGAGQRSVEVSRLPSRRSRYDRVRQTDHEERWLDARPSEVCLVGIRHRVCISRGDLSIAEALVRKPWTERRDTSGSGACVAWRQDYAAGQRCDTEKVHRARGLRRKVRSPNDNIARRILAYLMFSYLSAPTKMLTEMVADQVAPSYWIPNKDVHVRARVMLSAEQWTLCFLRSVPHVNSNSARNTRNITVEVCWRSLRNKFRTFYFHRFSLWECLLWYMLQPSPCGSLGWSKHSCTCLLAMPWKSAIRSTDTVVHNSCTNAEITVRPDRLWKWQQRRINEYTFIRWASQRSLFISMWYFRYRAVRIRYATGPLCPAFVRSPDCVSFCSFIHYACDHALFRELLFSEVFDRCSFFPGSGTVEIPTTRRVYETVKSGLEKIGANYPIGEFISRAVTPSFCAVLHDIPSLLCSLDQRRNAAELLATR